jgi:hypothetical protein
VQPLSLKEAAKETSTMEGDILELVVRDCSECGRTAVSSPLCVRPDLCYACFIDYLAEAAVTAAGGEDPR